MRKMLILAALCVAMVAQGKTLIAFYSYTGDSRAIVTELQNHISADVVEVEPAEKGLQYKANNYALGTQLLNAIKANPNNASSYPAIDPVTATLTDYDLVIIVTPLWWSQMAAITQSFLFNYGSAFNGTNVALVVSSYSSGISGVVADFNRLLPNANRLDNPLWINNSNRSNKASLIAEWVSNLPAQTTALNDIHTTNVDAPAYTISGQQHRKDTKV